MSRLLRHCFEGFALNRTNQEYILRRKDYRRLKLFAKGSLRRMKTEAECCFFGTQ